MEEKRKRRARPLRRRLALPLAAAFAGLWLGTMALFTSRAYGEMESYVNRQYQSVQDSLDREYQAYRENVARGNGALAASVAGNTLTSYSYGLNSVAEGGMAILIADEDGTIIRSQLSYGHGYEDGPNQGRYWALELDSALDDLGQLELARWLLQHRFEGTFQIYPPEYAYGERGEDGTPLRPFCDGTYARVTGVPKSEAVLEVRKLELVHPDGQTKTVLEAASPDTAALTTVNLRSLNLYSVLLPSWGSAGDGETDMERHLSNFLEAQSILDRALAGEERAVVTGGGRLLSGTVQDSVSGSRMRWYVAGQCDVFAAVWEQERGLYLSSLALLALVVVFLSRSLSRRVTQPVEELSREVQTGRCQTGGPVAELNTLARAFNAAQDRLAGQLERERQFTRAAAHELKTPLAVLRAHGEALKEDLLPEKRGEYLGVILDECDRMAALVGSLLELSRLESGVRLQMGPVELSALVGDVWGPLALPLEQKHVSLSLELEEVWAAGDRERLREAVGNLASNALRHTPPGGGIRVSLVKEGDWARLTVCNDGPPIPEEDLPHLFEPFYRGDSRSRSRESGGSGLGLAIVRAAVAAHGGSCQAENRETGVRFQLTLPLDGPKTGA